MATDNQLYGSTKFTTKPDGVTPTQDTDTRPTTSGLNDQQIVEAIGAENLGDVSKYADVKDRLQYAQEGASQADEYFLTPTGYAAKVYLEQVYNEAKANGDTAAMEQAHDLMNQIRYERGYTGGADGSQYNMRDVDMYGEAMIQNGGPGIPRRGSGQVTLPQYSAATVDSSAAQALAQQLQQALGTVYSPTTLTADQYSAPAVTSPSYTQSQYQSSYTPGTFENTYNATQFQNEYLARQLEAALLNTQAPDVSPTGKYHYDTQGLRDTLDQWQDTATRQQQGAIDYAVQQAVTELQRALEDAQPEFKSQAESITRDERQGMDNSALYAELRGDKGGIGQAQYNEIQATAAANRQAVQTAQVKLATDTARQIEDLRAQGEFQKADAALQISQQYLQQLMSLEQWAAEYNLTADQFEASLLQWQANYEASMAQFNANLQTTVDQFNETSRQTQANLDLTAQQLTDQSNQFKSQMDLSAAQLNENARQFAQEMIFNYDQLSERSKQFAASLDLDVEKLKLSNQQFYDSLNAEQKRAYDQINAQMQYNYDALNSDNAYKSIQLQASIQEFYDSLNADQQYKYDALNAQVRMAAAELEQSASQSSASNALSWAQLMGQDTSGNKTLSATSTLASLGLSLLEAGIMPSAEQLSALGMTETKASDYLLAQQLAAAQAATGKTSGGGSPGSSSGSSGSAEAGILATMLGMGSEAEAYDYLVSKGLSNAKVEQYMQYYKNNQPAQTTTQPTATTSGESYTSLKNQIEHINPGTGVNVGQVFADKITAALKAGSITEAQADELLRKLGY